MAYLEERETKVRQYRAPRRETPVGIIGVHTAENILDSIGPDTGAENVAAFMARRADPGSYHDIVDRDSIVPLVSYPNEAFHIGTHRLNRSTTGLSFACRTTDWARMTPPQKAGFIRNGATAALRQVAYHRQAGGVLVPARRITLEQALNGEPGYLAHSDADPERRSDPGGSFPWREFFAEIGRQQTAVPPTPTRRQPMFFARIANEPHVWVTDGINRRHVPNVPTLERLQGVAQWGLLGADRASAAFVHLVANEAELTALAGLVAPTSTVDVDINSLAPDDVESLIQRISQRSVDELRDRLTS